MAHANVLAIRQAINAPSRLIPIQPQHGMTFADAAASYLQHGGSPRYLQPIVDYFDGRPLTSTFPFGVRKMAEDLYPNHKGSTRNRQAIRAGSGNLHIGDEWSFCLTSA